MAKTHLKVDINTVNNNMSEYDQEHQTACGYIRDDVTRCMDNVDCFYCLRSEYMKHYHKINNTFTDSSGCY